MFDLVIGTLFSSFCNFAAQHIYTEPLTKLGEVKYPQVRLNPANIYQRRQISADFFRSAQSVHFLAPRSTSIIAPAFLPKRPIFSTSMSLCYTCLCARVLFSIDVCCPVVLKATPSTTPASLCCPLLSVDRSWSGSKSQESLDSFPTTPDQRPPSHCTTHFSHFERSNSHFPQDHFTNNKTAGLLSVSPPRLGTGQRVRRGRCLCK